MILLSFTNKVYAWETIRSFRFNSTASACKTEMPKFVTHPRPPPPHTLQQHPTSDHLACTAMQLLSKNIFITNL